MAQAKIAIVTRLSSRTDLIKSLAPPDVEVTLVDLDLPEDEKKALCRNADAIISSQVSTAILRECPNVKLIQTLSAGFDRLDIEAIGELGIPIANNGGANAIAVSEQTIALMIAVSKKTMVHWDTVTRQRQWKGGWLAWISLRLPTRPWASWDWDVSASRWPSGSKASKPRPFITTSWISQPMSKSGSTPGRSTLTS